MPARNVGINSTFEQQRQVINALAVDVDTLITTPVVNAGYASTAGIATYASVAGLATYSSTSGYASTAGIATQALLSSSSNYATVSGISSYSLIAGVSTLSQGLTGSPNISISGMSVSGISTFTSSITLNDSSSISFGDDSDLRITHTGSASRIFERGTGNLQITSNGGEISLLKQISDVDSGEYLARFHTDGGVDLYYDNNKKFEIVESGAVVTGVLTATSFSGIGSNITGISTLNIVNYGVGLGGTGGGSSFDQDLNTTNDVTFNRLGITTGEISVGYNNSLLINVDDAESGVSTYTFDTIGNLTLPGNIYIHGNSGYVLFNNGGSKLQAEPNNDFEIHVGGFNNKVTGFGTDGSLSVPGDIIVSSGSVGIGTTNPTSALTVIGDGKFTGIVTATRFESTSAGTPTIDSPNNLNINAVNVAISTDLTVGGDAYVGVSTARGLILTSPNGTQYRLIVDNSGTLSTVLVP